MISILIYISISPYGYVASDSAYYFVNDHQGNVRQVVYGGNERVVQETHYCPYGMPFGESTAIALPNGSDISPYKFGGKENVSLYKFNFLDFGARPYYSTTGQFEGDDPLREKYYPFGPRAYCAGDPVNFCDPTGKKIEFNGTEEETTEILGFESPRFGIIQ